MLYHWIEWDMWDKLSRRHAIIEKKIIFEKNSRNGIICVTEPDAITQEKLKDDVELWRKKQGIYEIHDVWRPQVKFLTEETLLSNLEKLIGSDPFVISFGLSYFLQVFMYDVEKIFPNYGLKVKPI